MESLGKIKRIKVEPGHWIYAGYHIRRTKWVLRSKYDGRIRYSRMVWVIDGFLPKTWDMKRCRSLERAIMLINNMRHNLWAEVHQIEDEKVQKENQAQEN